MEGATAENGYSFWEGRVPETDQFRDFPIWLESNPELKLPPSEINSKSWNISTESKYGVFAIIEATLKILGSYLYSFENSDRSTVELSVNCSPPYLCLLVDYPRRQFLEANSKEPLSKFQIRQRISEAVDTW